MQRLGGRPFPMRHMAPRPVLSRQVCGHGRDRPTETDGPVGRTLCADRDRRTETCASAITHRRYTQQGSIRLRPPSSAFKTSGVEIDCRTSGV